MNRLSLSGDSLFTSKYPQFNDTPNFATGGFTLLHDDEEVLIPLSLS